MPPPAATTDNPYFRRGRGRRVADSFRGVGRFVRGLPADATYAFKKLPYAARWFVLALVVVGLALFGWKGVGRLQQRAKDRAVMVEARKFSELTGTNATSFGQVTSSNSSTATGIGAQNTGITVGAGMINTAN